MEFNLKRLVARIALYGAAASSLAMMPANAIIMRDDVPEERYLAFGQKFRG